MPLQSLSLSQLRVRDARSFRHIDLYARLHQLLIQEDYRFRVPTKGSPIARWAPSLFLNLSFWNAAEASDVLEEAAIDADVVCHAGWHLAARKALQSGSAEALFLGEAIASAFDLYLVGRILGVAPRSRFLATQVPAMSEVAENAGCSEEQIATLFAGVAENPEGAFEDLRALLFETSLKLFGATGVDAGAQVLEEVTTHRFAPLLHHYELATWLLYARAYGRGDDGEQVRTVHATLKSHPSSLSWLSDNWLKAG